MSNEQTLLGSIDPELRDRLVGRRDVIGRCAAALALGSVPVALAALSREAKAQTTSVTDVLNFALMLEIFENEFYKAVLGTSASAAQNAAFATARAAAQATPGAVAALTQIQKHEQQHVTFLLANGASNVLNLAATSFDFTGNRLAAGGGPFARAGAELPFLLAVAQGAEDTGVRAYKGQAPNLVSNAAALEAALRIHSVEARHASKIRRLRRATGAPSSVRYAGYVAGAGLDAAGVSNLANLPAAASSAFAAIYAGEGEVVQGGVTTTTLGGVPSDVDRVSAARMAFDEPLSREEVRAIVQPFFIPSLP